MNTAETISRNLADKIASTVENITEEKQEQIEYVIYSFVANLYKLIIIFGLAYFLGILKDVLCVYAGFGIVRMFAGGIHAKSSMGCLVFTSTIFLGIVYGSKHLPFSLELGLVILFFNLYCVFLYAPADIITKPIISKKLARLQKRMSFIAVLAVFAVAVYVDNCYSTAIMFASFVQCILITPIAYKVTKTERGEKYEFYQKNG